MIIWRYRKQVEENGIFFCTDQLQFVIGPIDMSCVISKIATEMGLCTSKNEKFGVIENGFKKMGFFFAPINCNS